MTLSLISSALVAAIVGFAGTLAIVVAAAQAVGADAVQTSSWVTALCLAMAGTSASLSLWTRMPIITAWSTPGAALIAASAGQYRLDAAVGAFIVAALLILATAALKPLLRLIARIPAPIAAAMLAGVLARFVVGVFDSAGAAPSLVLPMIGAFLVARLAHPSSAILVALVAGLAIVFAGSHAGMAPIDLRLSGLTPVAPAFDAATIVGLGLPLFLVTMASQNLAGFAVLAASGYPAPAARILAVTGFASLATAPFGAHTSNLAAISAAICTGPDAHPDPSRRWIGGVIYGGVYLVFAALGASLVSLVAALPPAFIAALAGLGLIGAFAGALAAATADETRRFPAVLTFAVTASGFAPGGIGPAFWGLVAGLLALGLDAARRRR